MNEEVVNPVILDCAFCGKHYSKEWFVLQSNFFLGKEFPLYFICVECATKLATWLGMVGIRVEVGETLFGGLRRFIVCSVEKLEAYRDGLNDDLLDRCCKNGQVH